MRSAALGFFVATGSRGEAVGEAGLSHFLEHLLFRGTDRYGSAEIDQLFDGMGAELNAGTDKESTAVYARMLDQHLPAAFDVMVDMVWRPAFKAVDPERDAFLRVGGMQNALHHQGAFPALTVARDLVPGEGAAHFTSHELGDRVHVGVVGTVRLEVAEARLAMPAQRGEIAERRQDAANNAQVGTEGRSDADRHLARARRADRDVEGEHQDMDAGRLSAPVAGTTSGERIPVAVALRRALSAGYDRATLRADVMAGIVVGIVALPLWNQLAGYQKQRLLIFLQPESDPRGAGWNVIQSKVAIGSGGWLGKGFLEGTQKRLAFLPERHTDFIFSVLGEELGYEISGLDGDGPYEVSRFIEIFESGERVNFVARPMGRRYPNYSIE